MVPHSVAMILPWSTMSIHAWQGLNGHSKLTLYMLCFLCRKYKTWHNPFIVNSVILIMATPLVMRSYIWTALTNCFTIFLYFLYGNSTRIPTNATFACTKNVLSRITRHGCWQELRDRCSLLSLSALPDKHDIHRCTSVSYLVSLLKCPGAIMKLFNSQNWKLRIVLPNSTRLMKFKVYIGYTVKQTCICSSQWILTQRKILMCTHYIHI